MFDFPDVRSLPGIGADYYADNDQAALGYLLGLGRGLSPSRGFIRFLASRYPELRAEWAALLPFNPNLSWVDFASPDRLRSDFAAADPFERGERPHIFAPSARFNPF